MTKLSAFLVTLYLPLWLFVPPLILAWLPFYVYRCLVKLMALLARPDLIKMVTPGDAIFSYNRIHTCPVSTVVGHLELEGEVDPDHIQETLRTQILTARDENGALLYPEMEWTITYFWGFSFWAKAATVENPVRTIKEAMTHEDLVNFKAKLTHQPFKVNGPLWELLLVRKKNNSDEPPTTVALLRFQHTLIDGVGSFHLLKKMVQPQAEQCTKDITILSKKPGSISPIRYLRMPYDFMETCRESSRSGCLAKEGKNWIPLSDNFLPSEAASRYTFHISEPIAFSRIRQLGAQHGVTASAVMHSAILGAVRTSLCPKGTSFITVETPLLPPWKRDRPMGNNITHGRYLAPIGELDVVKRLIRTHEGLRTMKESTYSVTTALISNAIGTLPRPVLNQIPISSNESYRTIYVGNVPGPREQTNFCGYVVKEMSLIYGFCVAFPVLGVGLLTYGDDLRIGVFGNKNLLPRPGQAEEIACGFMQELDDLQFVE
ncbi:uncharacterized protein LOC110842024 [Folsomia candida]|uniref:O-acyltransferase WSD1 C-terminal domain-containing protein n=1 Tax=Folsomia candida TaxID=158441 RepID=A0A226EXR8_FOLCA|nr:uncharacterized protein LOC110842024 [Folsomia candida]OXA61957.1 hypothetical protein Fcan01_00088 [Folsomia candida]